MAPIVDLVGMTNVTMTTANNDTLTEASSMKDNLANVTTVKHLGKHCIPAYSFINPTFTDPTTDASAKPEVAKIRFTRPPDLMEFEYEGDGDKPPSSEDFPGELGASKKPKGKATGAKGKASNKGQKGTTQKGGGGGGNASKGGKVRECTQGRRYLRIGHARTWVL